jgi:hypothetical protein
MTILTPNAMTLDAEAILTASAMTLDAEVTRKIAHILRGIFPHDALADGPYQRSAEGIVSAVSLPRDTGLVLEGVRSLEELTGGDLTLLSPDELGMHLKTIENTEFFAMLLTSAVVSLYRDPETWQLLGYEGSAVENGGYLGNFNDLTWLPEPRIEEYDGGDAIVEIVPSKPGAKITVVDSSKAARL